METTNNHPLVVRDDEPVELRRDDPSDSEDAEDMELVRDNLRKIVERGKNALDALFDIVESAEHPAFYDSLSTMINSVVKANKELLSVSARRRESDEEREREPRGAGGETHNHLYVGSTAELLEIIEKKKSEK